jgi:hypothetical protein
MNLSWYLFIKQQWQPVKFIYYHSIFKPHKYKASISANPQPDLIQDLANHHLAIQTTNKASESSKKSISSYLFIYIALDLPKGWTKLPVANNRLP